MTPSSIHGFLRAVGVPPAFAKTLAAAGAASFQHHNPNAGMAHDYDAGENVWVNSHTLLHIFAGCDNWLDILKLKPNNNDPVDPNIEIGEVIRKIDVGWFADLSGPPSQRVYNLLIDFITQDMGRKLGDPTNPTGTGRLYLFNEDWRKGMDSQAARLGRLVDRIIRNTGQQKVVIITHSYGGPTTQYYLRTHAQASQKVDQVISLGGGYMGVIRPYEALVKGVNWIKKKLLFKENEKTKSLLLKLKKTEVQDLARDWPTAYWQLPQKGWFTDPLNLWKDKAFIEEVNWDANGDGIRSGTINSIGRALNFIEKAPARNRARTRAPFNSRFSPNINPGKFKNAQNYLLIPPPGRRPLGDWRKGTGGVFYHRVVGWGSPTTVRMQYKGAATLCTPNHCWTIGKTLKPIHGAGDGTIPLRSAVGILNDFDSRVWGLHRRNNTKDWDGSSQGKFNESDGEDKDNLGFHTGLPRIPSVLRFIKLTTEGKLTDITQLPSKPWPNQQWPFLSPPGVPNKPATAPQSVSTSSGNANQRFSLLADSEEDNPTPIWKISWEDSSELHIFDSEGGHSGPVLDPPHSRFVEDNAARVDYERGPDFTYAYLPHDAGTYKVSLKCDEPRLEAGPALGILKIEAVDSNYRPTKTYAFYGVPINKGTMAHLEWDTAGTSDQPELRLDLEGDGELLLNGTPEVTLKGPNAGDFTVVTPPANIVSRGQSTTFAVEFHPSEPGEHLATVSISNTDSDADPYTFGIGGTLSDQATGSDKPRLTISLADGAIQIDMEGEGTLQVAPSITGPWKETDQTIFQVRSQAQFFRAVDRP